MKRRAFLQAIGAAFGALAIPSVVAAQVTQLNVPAAVSATWAAFNPTHQYGNAVDFTDLSAVEAAKDVLLENARNCLPPGTKGFILDGGEVEGFDEAHCLAWYYSPTPLSDERRAKVISEFIA